MKSLVQVLQISCLVALTITALLGLASRLETDHKQKELLQAQINTQIYEQEKLVWQIKEAQEMVKVEAVMERYYSKFRK